MTKGDAMAEAKAAKSGKEEKVKKKAKTKEAENDEPKKKVKKEKDSVKESKKAKKEKKEKSADGEKDKGKKRSRTEAEESEPDEPEPEAKKLKGAEAAIAAAETSGAEEPKAEADPLAVDNFELSRGVKSLLLSKGIAALFPIQAQTLGIALEGLDVVGRARTGCGKTLAFVLPIVESLSNTWKGGRRPYGRKPAVMVLCPTRELANQVHADFEYIGKAGDLSTLCLYGGAPYQPQENKLRAGVDIVVGTPGRVKDHIERKTLDLSQLK